MQKCFYAMFKYTKYVPIEIPIPKVILSICNNEANIFVKSKFKNFKDTLKIIYQIDNPKKGLLI